MPTRLHFNRRVIPDLYSDVKNDVVAAINGADSIALTTDGWTSRATESYVTIMAHIMAPNWEMTSFVLQTRPLYESHTGINIREVLRSASEDWGLERPTHLTVVLTDNARNMDIAVRDSGFGPHIKCFAHTLNLATQKALQVPRVSRILGRVRRIASFFHRSSTAPAALNAKHDLLGVPKHKLIMDVTTLWNSSYDMLDRYLEQQTAVTAARMSPEVRRNARDINTLDISDITVAEDLVKLLKPLKTATTVLCDEKLPTVSLIIPMKTMIEQSMAPDANDSQILANVKSAILKDISGRYADAYESLLEGTALDPRFLSLQQLDEHHESVFDRLKKKAVELQKKQVGCPFLNSILIVIHIAAATGELQKLVGPQNFPLNYSLIPNCSN